jgi:hypothetical protein
MKKDSGLLAKKRNLRFRQAFIEYVLIPSAYVRNAADKKLSGVTQPIKKAITNLDNYLFAKDVENHCNYVKNLYREELADETDIPDLDYTLRTIALDEQKYFRFARDLPNTLVLTSVALGCLLDPNFYYGILPAESLRNTAFYYFKKLQQKDLEDILSLKTENAYPEEGEEEFV